MADSNNSSGGIGFLGLLAIVFIVLRLIPRAGGGHLINWSWWWVLAPLWIPAVIGFAILIIVLLVAVLKGKR